MMDPRTMHLVCDPALAISYYRQVLESINQKLYEFSKVELLTINLDLDLCC